MTIRQALIDAGVLVPANDNETPRAAIDRHLEMLPALELDEVGRAAAMRPLTPEEERALTRGRPSGGAMRRRVRG